MLENYLIPLTNTLIEVYVVGEVEQPGKLLIKNGTQLSQAVYYAGPTDLRANKKSSDLIRMEYF